MNLVLFPSQFYRKSILRLLANLYYKKTAIMAALVEGKQTEDESKTGRNGQIFLSCLYFAKTSVNFTPKANAI
ncbi:transcriptional regulator [Fischerella thermalis CCMEE 5201]|nr:transcriptional regulator [Fischerella thermalis CCMEE 5201]